jgi:hypothetical protein
VAIDHVNQEPVAGIPLPRFRCLTCSYRASRRIAPERCPMCGASTWELDSPRSSIDAGAIAADKAKARASRAASTSAVTRMFHRAQH